MTTIVAVAVGIVILPGIGVLCGAVTMLAVALIADVAMLVTGLVPARPAAIAAGITVVLAAFAGWAGRAR